MAGSTEPAAIGHGRLRKRSPWRTVLAWIGASLAVVLVSVGAVAGIAIWKLQSNITTVDIGGEADGPAPTIGEYDGGFNILIVGSDQCEEALGNCDDREETLNDVTMLLHVAADHSNAVAVSFPRDLIVPIPECPVADGSGDTYSSMSGQPINVTLSYGGLPCTVLTVEALTGLDVQFAGLVTFNGVIEMSNAVGGVPVCVTGPMEDIYTGLNLPAAGEYTLQGAEALAFLRARSTVGDGSDLTRISSQQVFLSSLVRTIKSDATLTNIPRLYALASAATRNMTLSKGLASLDTMVSIAQVLKDIPLDRIAFVQYPGFTHVEGEYYEKVLPDHATADALFAKIASGEPFGLAAAGDGQGSALDPNAPVAAPPAEDPSASPEVSPEVLEGIKGQTAADYTCTIAQ